MRRQHGLVFVEKKERRGHLLHHTKRMAPRDNGCLVDGVRSFCVEGNQRMPALMIGGPLQRLCCPDHGPTDTRGSPQNSVQCRTGFLWMVMA